MMNKITRLFNVEMRETEEPNTVEGMAVVFDTETDMGWFTEKIDRHAFDETDMSDVVLNFNHDNNYLLAGTRNGSMQLRVDDNGVFQRSNIINTTQGQDVMKLIRSGLLSKQSFAFTITEDGERWENIDGKERRTITKIDHLYDCSIVTFPAYSQTTLWSRGADELADQHKALIEKRKEQDERMEKLLNGNSVK